MNDEEFKRWLEQLSYLDADQFEEALKAHIKSAQETIEQGGEDPAWMKVLAHLILALVAVRERVGN